MKPAMFNSQSNLLVKARRKESSSLPPHVVFIGKPFFSFCMTADSTAIAPGEVNVDQEFSDIRKKMLQVRYYFFTRSSLGKPQAS
jgi:hypothetical protein